MSYSIFLLRTRRYYSTPIPHLFRLRGSSQAPDVRYLYLAHLSTTKKGRARYIYAQAILFFFLPSLSFPIFFVSSALNMDRGQGLRHCHARRRQGLLEHRHPLQRGREFGLHRSLGLDYRGRRHCVEGGVGDLEVEVQRKQKREINTREI